LAHVRDVSGVEVLSENEKAHGDTVLTMEKILNPKKVEEIEEVVDKSISTEESSARNDRYFSIDEEDRDMVDTLALAISNAVGKPINSQDVLEALAQSGISIYPVLDK
jgi:ACT domain-containing protein